MDEIVSELNIVSNKRRTTYKKITEAEIEDHDERPLAPTVLGKGFLFESDSINRVRNRLNAMEASSPSGISTLSVSQTQLISNFYEGGEELEVGKNRGATRVIADSNETQTIDSISTLKETQNDEFSRPNVDIDTTQNYAATQMSSDIEHRLKVRSIKGINVAEKTAKSSASSSSAHVMPSGNAVIQVTKALPKMRIIQQQLDVEDRSKICPIEKSMRTRFHVKNSVTKESFLESFDDPSSSDNETTKMDKSTYCKREPIRHVPDSRHSLIKKYGALKNYEHDLKRESKSEECILLSSEDDEMNDNEFKAPQSFASKASVLEFRAKLSKQKNSSARPRTGTTLKELFAGLKKASKRQILEHQTQLMERKGLNKEAIEREQQIVESLLEQEIARNKRIRNRERQEEGRNSSAILQGESSHSGDEESDDFSASDKESISDNASVNMCMEMPILNQEMSCVGEEAQESSNDADRELSENEMTPETEERIQNADDDNYIDIRKHKGKQAPVIMVSDSESDDENNNNAIDLGTYGDNLDNEAKARYAKSTSKPEAFSEEEDAEEERRQQIAKELSLRRFKEAESKRKREEMKKKGVSKMLEIEAEESEDEWHGLGGADGELSEEYDSEVEKLIDDYSKTNADPGQIRSMLSAENKEMDLKMVNKILEDIKNGGFRKRRREGFSLEISDDEDEELENYRLRRRELMRQKRLAVPEDDKRLIKNAKTKAFFESMMEDIIDKKENEKMKDFDQPKSFESESVNQLLETGEKRKKSTISEEFVQRSLSFLKSSRDTDIIEAAEESAGDLFTLKKHSFIKALHTPGASKEARASRDEFEMPEQRYSISGNFGSSIPVDDKLRTGKKTVTVSKSYKTVSCNRASITYLGKIRRLVAPKKRQSTKIGNKFGVSKSHFNSLFETNDSSFEV